MTANHPQDMVLSSKELSSFIYDQSFDASSGSSSESFMLVDNHRIMTNTTTMDSATQTENVSTLMIQVLTRLEKIVENFREKGENDAANNIARHTISTVNIFNNTVERWDGATASTSQPSPDNQSPQTTSDSSKPRSTGISWAAVAAVAPAVGNKIVKFTPKDTIQTKIEEERPRPYTPEVVSDMRVVWIRGWPIDKPMEEVTDKIGQGPLYSMAYSERDAAVCVIFQYASSAKALCEDDQHFSRRNGHSRFGPGCDVVEGLPFPENKDLYRMNPPHNERRRLTFARSQLFTNGLTRERFKDDIASIVGEQNVELVWLFNSGNATVVLSAVPLARLVVKEFHRIAQNHNSPYRGVTITYSHDPCERPMNLTTQLTAGRMIRSTTYGRTGLASTGNSAKNGSSSRRNTINEVDGWQTVSRRR